MEENEIIYSDIPVTEEHEEITVDEIMPVIEIAEIESYEIEMQEAFPSTEGNNSYNHALLNNREIRDAHPISAITGLREELNDIEALKTVYSDKKGNADYYEWTEGYVIDGVGRFVTLNKDMRTITICTGDDIFGVVVDNAAFVGGQDDVARDGRYGLVATSGAVHVRCELDVEEGNYVVSNSRGIATKTTSNYGYKVVALHDIDGLAYATISLDIAADQVDSIGKKLQNLDGRVDANYRNIISATNLATSAYDKATRIGVSNQEMSNKVDGALGKVDQMASDVANMGEQVSSSVAMSAQASAIANSAANYAEIIRNEAIAEVNKALDKTTELREEFETTARDMEGDLEDAISDIEALTKDLKPLAVWPEGAGTEDATGIAGFVARANKDSVTLASVTNLKGDFGKSLAGFVSGVTESNSEIKALAEYGYTDDKGEKHYGAAGIMAEVDKNKSDIEAIAGKDGSIAGLQAQVDANKAAVDLVARRVDGTYEPVDTWSETDKNQSVVYYAKDTKTYWYYADGVWKDTTNASEAGLSSAIAGLQIKTDKNSSSIDSLASWQDNTNIAMTSIEQKADANGAYIQSMVANIDKYTVGPLSQAYGFTVEQAASILEEGTMYVPTEEVTEEYMIVLEALEAPVEGDRDPDKIYYTFEENIDGSSSKVYWSCRYNYATKECYWIGSEGDFPQYYTRTFMPHYLYKWDRIGGIGPHRWITVDKFYRDTDETNTSAPTVYFTHQEQNMYKDDNNNNYGYWYAIPNDDGQIIDIEGNPTEKYIPYTLYKWENHWTAVATLEGNVSNRAISQIRQDANSIEMRVTNTEGSYAGIEAKLTDTESTLTSLTNWQTGKNIDGENKAIIRQESDDKGSRIVIAALTEEENDEGKTEIVDKASLVLNVVDKQDGNGETVSSLVLEGDYINLQGKVTIGDFTTDVADKFNNAIASTKIEYALSNGSSKEDEPESGWDTTAPEWEEDKYMWQRTTITYTDRNKKPTVTVTCIQGAKGQDGTNGKDGATGPQGSPGVSVTSVVTQYCISTSNTTAIGDWKDSFDTVLNSYYASKDTVYIWSREKITYSSGNPTYSTPTVNSAGSFVASWCDKENKTLINGSKITTGSITAKQLNADAIQSNNYVTGNETRPKEVVNIMLEEYLTGAESITDARSESKIAYYGKNATVTTKSIQLRPNTDYTFSFTNWGGTSTLQDAYVSVGVVCINRSGESKTVYRESPYDSDRWYGYIRSSGIQDDQTIRFQFNFATILEGEVNKKNDSYYDWLWITDFQLEEGLEAHGYVVPSVYEPVPQDSLVPYDGYAASGTYLDLDTGNMYSKNFYIQDGKVSMTGEINAEAGRIGPLLVADDGLVTANNADDTSTQTVRISNDGSIAASSISVNQILSTDTALYFNQPASTAYDYTLYMYAKIVKSSSGNNMYNRLKITFSYSANSALGYDGSTYVGGTYPNNKITIIVRGGSSNYVKTLNIPLTAGKTEVYSSEVTYNIQSIEWVSSSSYKGKATKNAGSTAIGCQGHFTPLPYIDEYGDSEYIYTLGTGRKPWDTVYANTTTILKSDRNEKNTITPLTDKHSKVFDKLVPVTYKLNSNTSDRLHLGLIAQDVKQAIDEVGIDSKDFAAYCEWEKENGNIGCGLRYEEFIAMCIYEIQKLKIQVKELESKLSEEQHDET